jgi:hypothetical protein
LDTVEKAINISNVQRKETQAPPQVRLYFTETFDQGFTRKFSFQWFFGVREGEHEEKCSNPPNILK